MFGEVWEEAQKGHNKCRKRGLFRKVKNCKEKQKEAKTKEGKEMRKSKGKRLLSLLLTLCMVISLVPATAFAAEVTDPANAVVGDTMTTKTSDAPDAPEGTVWMFQEDYTVVNVTQCPGKGVEHSHGDGCYSKTCDHKNGHISTCYSESTAYALCTHENDSEHSGTVTLTDVVTIEGTSASWKKDHPAYTAVYAVYKAAYDEAYASARFWKDTAGKAAGVAALVGKTFCYTTSASAEPDQCTHTCSEVGGSCYTKTCLLAEHPSHTEDCYTTYYRWKLHADVNGNGNPDENETYIVTFETGCDVAVEAQSVLTGNVAKEPTVELTKAYYTFAGWNFDFETPITKDVTVKAIWTPNLDINRNNVADQEETYTIVYKADGVVLQEDTDLAYGAATPAYTGETPTKENYNFATWAPTVAATVSAPAEGNTIVYTATWTEKSQVTVVFDFGTGESDSKVIYTGNTVAKPEDPTYAEHIFQGWYDKDGNAFDFATAINAPMTLTARWAEDFNGNGTDDATEAKYTVTYKDGMNGAIFADVVKEVLVGMPTPQYTPTSTEYTFTGWDSDVADKVTGDVVYTATWMKDSNQNNVVDTDETVTVIVNGTGSVTVNGDKTTSFVYDSTKVDTVAIKATPGTGCYVADVKVGGSSVYGDLTFNGTAADYTLDVTNNGNYTVTVTFEERTVTVADNPVVVYKNSETITVVEQAAEIEAQIKAFVSAAGYDPATAEVTVYGAYTIPANIPFVGGKVIEGYHALDYGIEAVGLVWGNLVFNDATEKVKVSIPAVGNYPAVEAIFDVTLAEKELIPTEVRLNTDANVVVTYGEFTDEEVMAALLDGVYAGNEKLDAEVTFKTKPTKLNAGDAVEVTLVYAGDDEYKGSTATATITINKAPAAVTVNSQTVKYGTSYGELVTTAPADVDTIDLIVGVDAANLQLDKENGVKGAEAVVMMQLPELKVPDEYKDTINEKLEEILGITGAGDKLNDILNSEKEVSMKEAIALLQSMNVGDGAITNDVVNQVVQNLENIQAELGVEDIKVILNGKPEDIGVYLVAGITADQNYETAMNVGYLAITPDGQRAYLDWKIHDENGAVALPALQDGSYDLSAYVTEVAEGTVEGAEAELEHIFFGVDAEGNIILTQEQNDLTLGAYTELAFILNWGNTMYYAEPIGRAFVVVPKLIDVKFVDDSGEHNPDRVFAYDGTAHAMDVAVAGVVTEPGENLTVRYVGVQNDGTVYDSTTAPKHAGKYAVTAIYVERDAAGTITGMGFDLGAMWIQMNADATITVEDFVQKVYDGEGYNISNMIESDPADAKTLIITSSIDTTGDVSVNGLEGIGNNVNMDFPARVDEVLNKIEFFKPAYEGDGLTVKNLAALIEANEAAFTGIGFDTEAVTALTDLLRDMPDNTVVKFREIEDVAPSSVGAYVVMGMIFDPDYRPAVDTGLLVIAPAAEKVTLKYEEDFNGNNIFTTEGLKHIDLDAVAYDEDGEEIESLKDQIHNVYFGIDAKGNEVMTTDWKDLNAGVYTEYSYLLDVGNKTYYATPISRTFIIAPDLIDVDFIDENGNVNRIRKFTYDGEAHAMEAVAKYNGSVVTDGEMTYRYVGISGDGKGYYSTEAPAKAGVYTVTATYAEYENGSVVAAGFAVGEMWIEKAASTFELKDTSVVYDGDEHFVEVVNDEDAEYIALVANRADNTVNVLFPEELDAVVDELPADVTTEELRNVIEEVLGGIKVPERFQDNLEQMMDEVETLMDEVPDVTVTFNEDKPVNVGEYEVYAVTYAANHYSAFDKANLEITKRPVTITANDLTIEVGVEPEFTYDVDGLVDGDELEFTVSCPEYAGESGEYEIVVEYEEHPNYDVTTVNGTLTVTDEPKNPVVVEGVELDETELTLKVGEKETLTATVSPTDADNKAVTWTSSDESVVTVDENGKVTAVGVGTATITVTTKDGEYTAICEVTVEETTSSDEPSVTLDATNKTLEVGDTTTLTATVTPEDATVTWTSSDESVVTVDENGKVTAVGEGTATITATITVGDEEYKGSCTITVKEATDGDEEETFKVKVISGSGDGEYEEGDKVWIEANSKSGYKFKGWVVNEGDVELDDEDAKKTFFYMPDEDVEIEATYKEESSGGSSSSSGGGGGSSKYTITLEDVENGEVKSSHKKASEGTKVTITVNPEEGFEVGNIVVTTKSGKTVKEIKVTDNGDGTYSFKMPAGKVNVDVDFAEAAGTGAGTQPVIILTIDSVIAWVFDEYVTNDVAPVIRNARTMLPARFVAEALGGVVAWNADEQKVTIVKGETILEIFIGEPFAVVNGTPVQLDCPAFIENSRTYLPIRFIAENLGATVVWDGIAQTVTITPGK